MYIIPRRRPTLADITNESFLLHALSLNLLAGEAETVA